MITRILSGSSDFCGGEEFTWNNESSYNRTEFQDSTEEIRWVAYQVIAPITVGMGILGNVLNLLVLLTRPFIKGGTRVYLTALALSDLTVMITVIPMIIRWNRSQWNTYETAFFHAHIELFLNNIFIAASIFIVVCLTIERYFSVCQPTMFRSVHTNKIARMAILGCYAMAFFVSAPLTVLKIVCLKVESTCNEWDFQENNAVTDTIYWTMYLWFSEFLVRLGPCVVLAILNVLIIRKFRKITAKRKIFREALIKTRNRDLFDTVNNTKFKKALRNKKYQEEKRLMVLLRSIVVLFFVTMTPSAILSLLYSELREPAFGFQVFRAAANNLELANFALNFYVYFFCSKEFRGSLMQLFTGCVACGDVAIDAESGDVEVAGISNMLKVIKLDNTSELNSTGEKFSLEFSGRSYSMDNQ